MAGTSILDQIRGDPQEASVAAHLRALQGESVAYEREIGVRTWSVHIKPFRDVKDRIVGCIGVGFDVTDQKAMESQLQHAAQMSALGRMAAGIPEEALPTVNAALDDPDPHETVRIAACEALGQLGRAESAPLLIPRLSDMSAGVATAAAWALAQIDDPSATEALERAAELDRAYWVRQAATEALERRGIEAQ